MIEIREANKSQTAEIACLIMMAMTDDCCLYFCGEDYGLEELTSGRACSRSAEQTNLRRSRLLGANKMRLPCVGLLVDKSNPAGEALYSSAGFRYVGDSQWGGHPMKHMVL